MSQTENVIYSLITCLGGIAFWISVTFIVLKIGIEQGRQKKVDHILDIIESPTMDFPSHAFGFTAAICDQLKPTDHVYMIPRLKQWVCKGKFTVEEFLTAPNEAVRLAGTKIARHKFCLCCLIVKLRRII